jgi:hypothetical protein
VIELAIVERRAARLRERMFLAFGLKALNLGARLRKIEQRRHLSGAAHG